MSNLFTTAIAIQSNKRSNRIEKLSASIQPISSIVATPTSFDSSTGLFIATTIDGGEIQYQQGNFPAQPNQISVTISQSSLIGFGDWL